MVRLVIVVACARNGVIGVDNRLPWHLPGDLAHFKRVTLGKPVIMGRKTFESIGRPLPGRSNLVVTRNRQWQAAGVRVCHSLDEAVRLGRECAERDGVAEMALIGGAQLYAQALDKAQKIYLTEVDCEPEGDAVFPELNPNAWTEIHRQVYSRDDRNEIGFTTIELVKKIINFG